MSVVTLKESLEMFESDKKENVLFLSCPASFFLERDFLFFIFEKHFISLFFQPLNSFFKKIECFKKSGCLKYKTPHTKTI